MSSSTDNAGNNIGTLHAALPWVIVYRGHSEGFCDIDSATGDTVIPNIGVVNAEFIVDRVNIKTGSA